MRPTLTIRSDPSTPEGTFGIGTFYTPIESFQVHTLELPDHGNNHDSSCIPAGSYLAYVFNSPHFNRDVLRLIGVPGRDAIEIHPANFGGDEALGYFTQLRGCIALGLGIGTLTTPKGNQQRGIYKSQAALDMMLDAMGDETELQVIIQRGT